MSKELFISAITKVLSGIIAIGLLIFLPAGSFCFFRGWLLMFILFLPMIVAGFVLMTKNPELLKRRLIIKEEQKEQRGVILLSGLMFVFGFIVAGLDFRFSWSNVPDFVVVISTVAFLLAYILYAEVIRENEYLSRTIKTEENQRVVDTGLYGIVRHPMYTSSILLFLSMPLILGSVYSFLIFLLYPFIIARRITLEEEFLKKELAGYIEYTKKVKYKLIPFIW